MTYNDELYHWGIKGQKWGVRRYQNKDGTLTSAGKKRSKRKNDVKSMSDQELRANINRIQMEKQYKKLTKKEASAGQKFVAGIIAASATAVVTPYVTKYMKQGLEWAGRKLVDGSLIMGKTKWVL